MKRGAFFFLLCLVMAGTGLSQKMTVKDSDANVLMEVNDEGTVGSITVPSGSAPSTPTNKLYNVGGSLYWNGSALVTGGSSGWTSETGKVYTTTLTDKVGLNTSTPEFKLSLDKDGGILAKGKLDSGAVLSTSGEGTRLIWYPRKAAFRAGYVDGTQWDDANIGVYSVAMGFRTKASGYYSTAMGNVSEASTNYSTAMGYFARASGAYSTAMGHSTTASGDQSTAMGWGANASGYVSTAMGAYTTASGSLSAAMGWHSTASGTYSTVMGYYSTAESYTSLTLGQYNVGGGTANSWVSTDPLFEIGNGSNASNKANAMTVLKNGNVGIGTATPGYPLEVTGQVKITGGSPGAGKVLTSDASGLASWQTSAVSGGWTKDTDKVYTTTASDKVGIGTSAPQFKLTVEGDGGIIARGIFGGGADLGPTGSGTRMVWYPKKAAFRAGYVDGDQWDDGNVGEYSVSMGVNTKASGNKSVAMGAGALASGTVSTAMGDGTIASGIAATAMGYHSEANGIGSAAIGGETTAGGYYSTAMGYSTTADAYSSVAVGQYNVGGGTPGSWDLADPVFEIGIGTSAIDKANALTVLKNGNVGIDVSDPGAKLEVNGEVKITGGSPGVGKVLTSDASGLASWQTPAASGGWTSGTGVVYTTTSTDKVGIGTSTPEFKLSLDDGGGTNDAGIISKGTFGSGNTLSTSGAESRLIWYPKKAAFRAGFAGSVSWDDGNIGEYSTAIGAYTTASGGASMAMGYTTTASGGASTAMGYNTIASAEDATAMGWSTNASGAFSTAMGGYTTASGTVSAAMGWHSTAESYISMAIGRYNVGGGTADSWVSTDPLFEIGNGASSGSKANAVTVLKNGNVGIGTATPGYPLEVAGEVKITGGSPGAGKVLTSDASGLASWQTSAASGGWTSGTGVVYTTTPTDKVGIGTSTPEFKLSLDDGGGTNDAGIISKGTFGSGNTLSTSGAGTRMIWYPKKAAFRAGFVDGNQWDEANVGNYSVSMGYLARAGGSSSFAVGNSSLAAGGNSTAMGEGCQAQASGTTAIGLYSIAWADADNSMAMGYMSYTYGENSIAIGNEVTTRAYRSIAVGTNNVGNGTSDIWVETDPIFEIGIGDEFEDANAMTVLKNGNVGIGTVAPGYPLEVAGQVKITGGSPGAGKVLTSDASGLASWNSLASAAGWTSETDKVYTTTSTDKVGIGLSSPTSQLDVAGDIETGDGNAFYFGDPAADGSWRVVRSFNDLVFQKRVSSIWVTKGSISGS